MKDRYLENNVLALDVLDAMGVSSLLGPLSQKSQEYIYMYVEAA